jgi:hypothetical protein
LWWRLRELLSAESQTFADASDYQDFASIEFTVAGSKTQSATHASATRRRDLRRRYLHAVSHAYRLR